MMLKTGQIVVWKRLVPIVLDVLAASMLLFDETLKLSVLDFLKLWTLYIFQIC